MCVNIKFNCELQVIGSERKITKSTVLSHVERSWKIQGKAHAKVSVFKVWRISDWKDMGFKRLVCCIPMVPGYNRRLMGCDLAKYKELEILFYHVAH